MIYLGRTEPNIMVLNDELFGDETYLQITRRRVSLFIHFGFINIS